MKSTPVAIFDSWNRVVDRWNRHEETNSPDDLDALLSAIRDLTERQDIGDLPIEHAEQMGLAVGGLGEALIRRFMEARELRDLENGIELYQGAAALIPDSSEWKIRCLLRLPGCHTMRFKQTGDASHLRLAAEWAERALAAAKDGTTRAHALFDLGVILSEQFELNSELGTADAAVDRLTEALACSDPEQPHRKLIVKGLCGMLVKLTLAVPDAAQTGERWQKAIHSVPFRSFDQQTLSTAWRTAFEQRAKLDHPAPAPQPTFVEANRARLRDYAPFNEAAELRAAAARGAEVLEVRSYAELQEKLGRIREAYPEALLVFRGQTEFHEGRLAPSMARKNAREGERLLWIAALEENLRYGGPDPAALIERQLMESVGIEPGPADPRTLFWQQVDVAGPAGQAVLQHYGARTHFIDVSTSLEVALWFAHFRFRMRRDLFERAEFTARAGTWGKNEPLPEYDTAWYEPAWSAEGESAGYLFVVAPRLPQSGGALVHGEYIDLSPCPSERMRIQRAGLVHFEPQGSAEGAGTLAVIKFKLPLEGAPADALNESVQRLFPSPKDDPLYARILWCLPFGADPGRPGVLARSLRVPEYHPAPAVRPRGRDWSDWGAFRHLDSYVRPALAYPHAVKDKSAGACRFGGKVFQLANAVPVMPTFPTLAIQAPIPLEGALLSLNGHNQVFLEYDPLSSSLSPRAAAHHFTQQIDRRVGQVRSSIVPFPNVRGAWVIQAGELYWCRVFARGGEEGLAGTAGRAFGYDRQFGWVVKEGAPTDTHESALEMRAERAALYLVLGLAEQVNAGTWHLSEVSGSRYLRIDTEDPAPY